MGGQRPLAPLSASSGTSSPGEGAVRAAVAFGRRPGRRCFRRGEAGRRLRASQKALGLQAGSRRGRQRSSCLAAAAGPFRDRPACPAALRPAEREDPRPDSAPLQGGPRPRRLGKEGSERPTAAPRTGSEASAERRKACKQLPPRCRRMPRGAVSGNGGEMVPLVPRPRGGGSPSESGGCVPPGLGLGRNWAAPPAGRPPSSQPSPAVPRGVQSPGWLRWRKVGSE